MNTPEKKTFIPEERKNITTGFIFTILKNEGKESIFFKETLQKYFDECDELAEKEAFLLKSNGIKDSAVIARTRSYIKKIKVQLSLYKINAHSFTAEDLLDSLMTELESALQINCHEAEQIKELIDDFNKLYLL